MFDLLKPPAIGARALICGLSHGAALFTDLVDMLADNEAGAPRPFPPVSDECDCGEVHPPLPLPPALAALVANGLPHRTAEPADDHAWRPAFAQEIREADVVAALGGRARPMRVVEVRKVEPEFGMGPGYVALLLLDESGEYASALMGALEGIRIAVQVPESAAALDGAS